MHWGRLQRELGEPQAVHTLQRAVTTASTVFSRLDPRTSCALNDLATVYKLLCRLDEAEACYREALFIDRVLHGDNHPETLIGMTNLGLMLLQRGNADDLDDARILLRHVRDVDRRRLGQDHPDIANDHINWSAILRNDGDWAGAEAELREALRILTGGGWHPAAAPASLLSSLGTIVAAGDPSRLGEARELHVQALAASRRLFGDSHVDIAADLRAIGVIDVRLGDPSRGYDSLQRACIVEDVYTVQALLAGSERQRAIIAEHSRVGLHLNISLVLRHLRDKPEALRSCLDLVLRRKGIELELLALQQDVLLGTDDPFVVGALQEMARLRNCAARHAHRGSVPPRDGESDLQLADLKSQRDQLEAKLAEYVPASQLLRRLRVGVAEVAHRLPEDSALVEFVRVDVADFDTREATGESGWGEPRYVAFLLRSSTSGGVELVDVGAANLIDEMIARFNDAIVDHGFGWSDRIADLGVSLRERLFDSVARVLGDCRRLILAPDGALSLLSFQALPFEGGYLVDHYDITYIGVGRDLLGAGLSTYEPAPAVVAAAPDFDLGAPAPSELDHEDVLTAWTPGEPFASLEATAQEGVQVAQVLGVEPLLGDKVRKNVLLALASPVVVHVATHGWFVPLSSQGRHAPTPSPGGLAEHPLMRSCLALAGVNASIQGHQPPPDAGNGVLTADEVCSWDLRATRLVVLSACETGVGDIHHGEGVYGLRRAFAIAGARAMVMSAWVVADETAREFMKRFYTQLEKGAAVSSALRHAQLSVKRTHPEPYHWAAFVLIGEPAMTITLDRAPLA